MQQLLLRPSKSVVIDQLVEVLWWVKVYPDGTAPAFSNNQAKSPPAYWGRL